MDISAKIKNMLEEYFEDELNISCEYYEESNCFVSPKLKIKSDMAANVFSFVCRVYPDAFDISICVGIDAKPENSNETLIFTGLIENDMYPGTQVLYKPVPGTPIRFYRYVDCYTDTGTLPSNLKIHNNFNIALLMYQIFADFIVAVNMGLLSAEEAYVTMSNQ